MRRLFDQIIRRPLDAFVLSMQMLGQRVDNGQRVDSIVSRVIHTLNRPGGQRRARNYRTDGASENAQGEVSESASVGARASRYSTELSRTPSAPPQPQPFTTENAQANVNDETHRKSYERLDTNLADDKLKLVRYKILFVKRGLEVAFPEREEFVSDNLSETNYAAWKIAEFIAGLDETEIPQAWRERNYPPSQAGGGFIHSLPEEDKKYLRVFYEVLERYKRAGAGYKKRQLSALKGIRNSLRSSRPSNLIR